MSDEPNAPAGPERDDDAGSSVLTTFRQPHFAAFWSSNILQSLCFNVLGVTMQWLLTSLTDSRGILGFMGFAQGGTVARVSPVGGVVADRFPKRALLIACRLLLTALVAVIGTLVYLEKIEIWHLVVAAVFGGGVSALMSPAAQTIVFDLVGQRRIQSAVALNATGSGFAQAAGPALGGVLIAAVGIAGSYAFAAGGSLVAVALLASLPAMAAARRTGRPSMGSELAEGFRYVWARPPLRLALVACAMAIFNGALFPMRAIFARHVLNVSSTGFGGMAAAAGLGTVLTAMAMAWLPPLRRHGIAITASMLGYALCLVAYSFAFSYEYILAVEFMTGVTGQLWNVWTLAGIQLAVSSEMRGRIVSLVFMFAQLGFLGQLAVGLLADLVGDQIALATFGVIPSVVLAGILGLGHRTLRAL